MTAADLIARLEAATGPDRELADEVLLACGWHLNFDAEEIAQWRAEAGRPIEGEDGTPGWESLADCMRFACWYPIGNEPFRDSWIDGHYRPDPTASIDAALTLYVNVPEFVSSNPRLVAIDALRQRENLL